MEMMRNGFLSFALSVAAACNNRQTPETAAEAEVYLAEILNMAFANTGIHADVQAMAYPPSCKFPMIITINGTQRRLLWFYPNQPISKLSSELADLLCDVEEDTVCVPA